MIGDKHFSAGLRSGRKNDTATALELFFAYTWLRLYLRLLFVFTY